MIKGVAIGSAAALVVGVGLVAAAVSGRGAPAQAPRPAEAGPQIQIQLAAPKEPPAPAPGPKLETVPPGAPDVRQPAPVRAAPPPVRSGDEIETARNDDRWREPEPRAEDFIDEGEPPFLEQPPAGRYREDRARWRDRPYDDRRFDRYRPAEPYYPEAPPGWWRR